MEHSDAQVGALDQGESAIWKVNSILDMFTYCDW